MVINLFRWLERRFYAKKNTQQLKEQHNKKLNNRGMSLVEVIISITILSIVVVPTLQALTSAMTYNARARRRQELTLSGESIMESFKGYDIETLKLMFDSSYTPGAGYDGPVIESHGDGKVKYAGMNEKVFNGSATGGTYSLAVDPAGVCTFGIDGLTTETGRQYNVQITANPASPESLFHVVNMKTSDINVQCDIEWNEKFDGTNIDQAALADLKSNYYSELISCLDAQVQAHEPSDYAVDQHGNNITDAYLDSNLSVGNIVIHDRVLEFEINSTEIKPKVTYSYYVTNVPYYKPVHPPGKIDEYEGAAPPVTIGGTLEYLSRFPESDSSFKTITKEFSAISTPAALVALDNVYLYYYPNYDMQDDKVVINNNSGVALNCYLIKQRAGNVSETWTTTHEQGYKVKVDKQGGNEVNLYHNLNENVGKPSSTVPDPEIATNFANGGEHKGENLAEVLDAGGNIKHKAADSEYIDKTLGYDLTLNITDTNGNLVTTLNSTMNEK